MTEKETYKTCPDCGCRIAEYGCTWCNEQDYIDMQDIDNVHNNSYPDWTKD